MKSEKSAEPKNWNEETSRTFINYGQYVIPKRDYQMQLIATLLSCCQASGTILELCCGEGLLAERLLEKLPYLTVHGLDGSVEMLQRARERLARFGDRFQSDIFDLASTDWRKPEFKINAAVSSMAIHHLTGPQKQELFVDVHRMLMPDGVFIIADIVESPSDMGKQLAAETLDEVVRERSLELDGNTAAFDFFREEGWNIFRYLDPEDIDKPSPLFDQLKWLDQTGFVNVDVHWMLAGHAIFSARKAKNE